MSSSRNPVYILGGYQTDFARNWRKEGKHISALIRESVVGALEATRVQPSEIEVAHVGNFAAELYCMQGHLGAFVLEADPILNGLPTARHEAACASGSVAALAAAAEIEAGRYEVALVVGVEQMKTVDSKTGGDYLGTAAWYEREAEGIAFPFPKLFGRLGDVYDARFGLKAEHLAGISAINYGNAKLNPKAQTRNWFMNYDHACSVGDRNPNIAGRIKLTDCSQVTDGAAAIVMASAAFAKRYAERVGKTLDELPSVLGWGHATAPIVFDEKVAESEDGAYVLPHTRKAIVDAFRRAELPGVESIDAIETHDCFTTSEYMAIDHFGLTAPGESWKAVEEGVIALDGECPINPSGGLIGAGHPVGCTGVRQLLDAYLLTTEQAGDYQVAGCRRVATLNIGGSGTTSVVHLVGFVD
jgi:acetyl-CoA C-acetyltransferase